MSTSFHTLPNERIVLKFRRHIMMLFSDTIGTIIVSFLPFILFWFLSGAGYVPEFARSQSIVQFASALWLLVVWSALAVQWTDYYLDLWIVTDSRIVNIEQVSLFDRVISTWEIERIQEITTRTENFIQTFFNYGTLQIQTSGPTDEYAKAIGVPDPERVRAVIMQQTDHVGALEKNNQDQEELLHTVSHEVKGYLAKDAAALATIAEDATSPQQSLREFASRALGETRKGTAAVMHMLDHADMKTGSMRTEASLVDLKRLVNSLVDEYRARAISKGLTLESTAGNDSYVVSADETKLRELVVRNLLDNALHYTVHGAITVTLTVVGDRVRVSVADTGVGISPEDKAHLFAPGGHGSHSRTLNPESTGFGLSSAKAVIDSLGGSIWAESGGNDRGSVFIFELPRAARASIV